MNVDKNDLISGLDLVVPKNPRNGWSKEARKIVNDAIEYINNSVPLDKVKQAMSDIENLSGQSCMVSDGVVNEVLDILDKLIAESEDADNE